jgi:hypothetical protein
MQWDSFHTPYVYYSYLLSTIIKTNVEISTYIMDQIRWPSILKQTSNGSPQANQLHRHLFSFTRTGELPKLSNRMKEAFLAVHLGRLHLQWHCQRNLAKIDSTRDVAACWPAKHAYSKCQPTRSSQRSDIHSKLHATLSSGTCMSDGLHIIAEWALIWSDQIKSNSCCNNFCCT